MQDLNFTYTQSYEDHLDKELEEMRKSIIAVSTVSLIQLRLPSHGLQRWRMSLTHIHFVLVE
jgi:hypothetical protein